jgi:hypothetical protein
MDVIRGYERLTMCIVTLIARHTSKRDILMHHRTHPRTSTNSGARGFRDEGLDDHRRAQVGSQREARRSSFLEARR